MRKKKNPKEASQGIPTEIWKKLCPTMTELRSDRVQNGLWRALIEANWKEYDKNRKHIQDLLDKYDVVREDEPKITDDDEGW